MSAADGVGLAVLAAFAFGVMYMPMKKCQLFDGVRFQLFMCTGILCVGLSGAFLDADLDLALEPLPLLGGGINGAANFLLLRLVGFLGMGVGYSLFHFAGIPTNYLIGRLGLWGVPRAGDAVADVGAGLVALSFVVLSFVPEAELRLAGGPRAATRLTAPIASAEGFHIDRLEHLDASTPSSKGRAKKGVGILLALSAGVLSAMSNVPATLWNLRHKGRPLGPVLPMFLGIWLSSVVLTLVHELICAVRGVSSARAKLGPALACGSIWGLGYSAFVLAIALAGFEACVAIGSIGSTLVSGFISVFWYKEVTGCRGRALFFAAAALQAAGVVMMARPDPPK